MSQCPKCGYECENGAQFCLNCGEALAKPEQTAAPAPQGAPQYQQTPAPESTQTYQAPPQYQAPQPQYQAPPQPQYQPPQIVNQTYVQPPKSAPEMTWGSFFWTRVLFAIPLVGFIFMIVWSFGGSGNKTRVQYARSYFFPSLILAGVALIFFVVILIIAALNGENIGRTFSEIFR